MSTRSLWSTGNTSRYLPIVFSLLTGLTGLSGCADPVIVDPERDGGTNPTGDGGSTNKDLPTFIASANLNPSLTSETLGVENNRRWKRDPHYTKDGNVGYLFFSGSYNLSEQWSLGYFTATVGSPLENKSPWKQALLPQPGAWDSKDLFSPFARRGSSDWSLYYAATGDSTKPDYVLQIGRATSADANTWTRGTQPVMATPAFSGTDVSATPTTVRKDAWGVTDPWIITESNATTMYYAGLDCSVDPCQFRIFRTVSTDGGTTFPPGEVVLSGRSGVPEEAGGVAGPSVVVQDNVYILAYTAVRNPATKSREGVRKALSTGSVGLAVSSDGKNFQPGTRDGSALVSRLPAPSYSSAGSGSPSLYLDGTVLRGFFAGLSDDTNGTYYSMSDMTLTKTQ